MSNLAITQQIPNDIKINLTPEEVHLVYRLRYDVYIKEMNYSQADACHTHSILTDAFDETGELFAAFKNNKAVGTCLTNYTKNSELSYYPDLYEMERIASDWKDGSSICTKLIVHPDHRSGPLAFKLALATYIKGLHDGIKYNFVDCEPAMVDFFRRLGYVIHVPEVDHPEFGKGIVMALELRNEEKLAQMRSPFLKYYRLLNT